MARVSRRAFCALGALLTIGLAGCPGPDKGTATPPPNPAPSDGQNTASNPPKKAVRVALVLDVGGRDDKSFNQGAWEGLERAQKELGLGENDIKYVESKDPSDYKTNLTTFASQNYDLVIAVGFKLEDA